MSEDKEPTPEELKAELEAVRDALKKVNAESAGRRKQLEAFEAEKKKLEDEKLSEAEKLQAQITATIDRSDEIRVCKPGGCNRPG